MDLKFTLIAPLNILPNIKIILNKKNIQLNILINIGNLIYKDNLEKYFTLKGSLKYKKNESQINNL